MKDIIKFFDFWLSDYKIYRDLTKSHGKWYKIKEEGMFLTQYYWIRGKYFMNKEEEMELIREIYKSKYR